MIETIEIKDIKKGDRFWEKWDEFEALQDGQFTGTVKWCDHEWREQWALFAKNVKTGKTIAFVTTDGSPNNPELTTCNCYSNSDDFMTTNDNEILHALRDIADQLRENNEVLQALKKDMQVLVQERNEWEAAFNSTFQDLTGSGISDKNFILKGGSCDCGC
ncbi:MAG: hypothetical protein EBU90_30755 [Proteobacteria bacterium]|nr:hypothetical protein [Pseudomonadota bacterium]